MTFPSTIWSNDQWLDEVSMSSQSIHIHSLNFRILETSRKSPVIMHDAGQAV